MASYSPGSRPSESISPQDCIRKLLWNIDVVSVYGKRLVEVKFTTLAFHEQAFRLTWHVPFSETPCICTAREACNALALATVVADAEHVDGASLLDAAKLVEEFAALEKLVREAH